jgi:hypothetical protein
MSAKCALVSTSGSLLEATWGSQIDSHEVEFRIGQGPVGGPLAAHVGSRTTVRIAVASLFQVRHRQRPPRNAPRCGRAAAEMAYGEADVCAHVQLETAHLAATPPRHLPPQYP